MSKTITGDTVRCGIFGTGFWSNLQIPAWSEIKGVNVVALYNRTVAKAEKAAQQFNVPKVYADAEELIKNENLDFMDIIVEAPAHEWLVGLGAKYGLPVICQKPIAHDWDTCRRMAGVCKKAGVPLLIHENFRWQYPIQKVKEALQQGHIGEILRADILLSHGGADAFRYQPYLHTIDHVSLFDMGCHILDVSRFLFGEVRSVYCQSLKTIDFMKGDDAFTMVLRQGRTICTCEVGTRTPFKIFIEGSDGSLLLGNDDQMIISTAKGTETRNCKPVLNYAWLTPELMPLCSAESIVACHQHMLDSLRGLTPCQTSARESLKTMKAVFAAIKSTVSGKAVRL